jgi:hypothetical protein
MGPFFASFNHHRFSLRKANAIPSTPKVIPMSWSPKRGWSRMTFFEKTRHVFGKATGESVKALVIFVGGRVGTFLMMGALGAQESWNIRRRQGHKLAEAQVVLAGRRETLGEDDALITNAHYDVVSELRWAASCRWLDSESSFAEAAGHFDRAVAIYSKVHGEEKTEEVDARVQAEKVRRDCERSKSYPWGW